MYLFICHGTPPHFSHSAAKIQRDPSCPVCGAESRIVMESKGSDEKGRIAPDHRLNDLQLFELAKDLQQRGYSETDAAYILRLEPSELRVFRHRMFAEIGKYARKRVLELHAEGKSNSEIADEVALPESRVRELLTKPRSNS
jgi:hypothetical protein